MSDKQSKYVLPPKRPMAAYFLFLNDIRDELVKDNPHQSVAVISKIAGQRWREVDPKTKSKYQKLADKAKEEYEVLKNEFELKYGSIKKARRRMIKKDKDEKKKTHDKK